MKISDLFENWNITGIKLKTPIMDMEWKPDEADKQAAWELYIELLTRITTQPLPDGDGIEQTALDSIYKLFTITREILKTNGRKCVNFSRIAVVVLNQVIRPFTAKWHRLSENKAFESEEQCELFRRELRALQQQLVNYTDLLSALADVENLTNMETE